MEFSTSKKLNIELVRSFHRIKIDSEYICPSRDSNAFIYYIKGKQNFHFPHVNIIAYEGDMLYIPYGYSYKNRVTDPTTEYYQIDFNIYEDSHPIPLFDAPRLVKKPDSSIYKEHIRKIRHDNYMYGDNYFFSCFSELCKLIEIILSNDDFNKKEQTSRIKASIEYIENNYQLNTPMPEIAAMSSTCMTNFERLFKQIFKMTPTMYRNTIRTNKAKHLLLAGYTIADVAERTGFYDSGHFSRTFKRIVGISPGEFAKSKYQ